MWYVDMVVVDIFSVYLQMWMNVAAIAVTVMLNVTTLPEASVVNVTTGLWEMDSLAQVGYRLLCLDNFIPRKLKLVLFCILVEIFSSLTNV